MNRDTMDRIKLAREYQKKAIYALFPDSAKDHLEVIENEMKAMMKDMMKDVMMDIIKQEMNKRYSNDSTDYVYDSETSDSSNNSKQHKNNKQNTENSTSKSESKVKKVTID